MNAESCAKGCAKCAPNSSKTSRRTRTHNPPLRHRDRSIRKTLECIPIPAKPILHRIETQRRLDSLFFGKYPRARSFFSSFATHEPGESAIEDTLSNISSSFVAYFQQKTPTDDSSIHAFVAKPRFFDREALIFPNRRKTVRKQSSSMAQKKPAIHVAGFSMQRYFR